MKFGMWTSLGQLSGHFFITQNWEVATKKKKIKITITKADLKMLKFNLSIIGYDVFKKYHFVSYG